MKKLIKYISIPVATGLLGMGLNIIVTQVNAGMPANTGRVALSKEAYDILNLPYPKWTALYEGTKFRILADILPFNLSIGDVLIYGSLLAYVVIVGVYFYRSRKLAPVEDQLVKRKNQGWIENCH